MKMIFSKYMFICMSKDQNMAKNWTNLAYKSEEKKLNLVGIVGFAFSTLHTAYYTMNSTYCPLHTAYYTVNTLYTALSSIVSSTHSPVTWLSRGQSNPPVRHSKHWSLNSSLCTLHSALCRLQTALWTLDTKLHTLLFSSGFWSSYYSL